MRRQQFGRTKGNAQGRGEHDEPEDSARSGMGHVLQDPRDHPAADDEHESAKRDHLESCDGERTPDCV